MSQLPNLFKLQCPIQDYHWGSKEFIQKLLSLPLNEKPAAELWMGAHPRASAIVQSAGEQNGKSLYQLIQGDVELWLGAHLAERFGRLPFLFKVLAADTGLSIQCHPDKGAAEEGFLRENQNGPALDSPQRNYKDDNHKPELLMALSSGFTILKGFRPLGEISKNLRDYQLTQLADEFDSAPNSYGFIVERILSAGKEQTGIWLALVNHWSKKRLSEPAALIRTERSYVPGRLPRSQTLLPHWLLELQKQYPGDPGCLMPLILNLYELRDEESVFLGPGELHAYLKGTGLEVMANSDNVLRGGLTTKHIDRGELLRLLKTEAQPVNPMVPVKGKGPWLFYPEVAEEFRLARFLGSELGVWVNADLDFPGMGEVFQSKPTEPRTAEGPDEVVESQADSSISKSSIQSNSGPSLFFALEGEFHLRSQSTELIVRQGEAVFQRHTAPADPVELSGRGRLYRVSAGSGVKK